MKQYIGNKLVKAAPMTRMEYTIYRGWVLPVDEDGSDEGYLIEYMDGGKGNHPAHTGYITWTPKAPFDAGYRETSGLTFGLALEALKKGSRLTRAGWNGSGLWIELVPTDGVNLQYLRLSYPGSSKRVPWVPSQTDVLAEDWAIL